MDFQDKKQEITGKLERLENQVRLLLMESKDIAFTEYLRKLTERVRNQVYQTDLLQDELDRSYRAYLQKMEMQEPVQQQAPMQQAPMTQSIEPQSPDSGLNVTAQQAMAQPMPESVKPQTVTAASQTAWNNVSPVYGMGVAPKQPVRKNAEFTIAAVALSILGGIFILTALVMLGMTIVDDFVKGISIYAISLVVLLISEAFVYRRLPKLGSVLSGIAFGGLYLTTMINYEILNNFDFWATAGIVLVISIAMLLVSRKRNSAFYRIFGVVSCFLSFMSLQWVFTNDKFLALTVLYFFINIMCILLPVKVHKTGINLTHMCFNLFFCFTAFCRPEDYNTAPILLLLLLGVSILINQVLLIVQVRHQWKEKAMGKDLDNTGILAVYWLGIVFYSAMLSGGWQKLGIWACHGSIIVLAGLCLLSFILLRGGREKWYSYYFLNVAAFVVYVLSGSRAEWSIAICMAAMLLVAKLLSLTKEKPLRVSEAFITAVSCLVMLVLYKETSGLLLCAAILIGVVFMNHWQTYYECIIAFSVAFFAALQLREINALYLPGFVGVLFAAMLLFNNVERFRGRNILVFNILALVGQSICYLVLGNYRYAGEYLTYFCMLIFGAATIILIFRNKYGLGFEGKYLILAVFLSYMTLILRTDTPIINSILLMLIALISVGMGFVQNKKSVRIYGLVLSLLVCGKIVLYDYWGAPTLQKTALFFAVGVIALIIAGIYIVLEKKANTTK